MWSLNVDVGEWVNYFGHKARVCGLTRQKDGSVSEVEVCFRPHQFKGFFIGDHRRLVAPFVAVSVIGKLDPEPFSPWGQETQDSGL